MDIMKKILLLALACNGFMLSGSSRKAYTAYTQGDYAAAQDSYVQILERNPYDALANYNLGDVLYRQNQYQQAIDSFDRAIDHAGSDQIKEQAYYNKGNSLFQLKEYQSAIEAYEQALKIDSKNERSQHNLELARRRLKEQQDKEQQEKEEQEQDKKEQEEKQQDQQNKEQSDQNDQKQDQQNQQDKNNQSGDQQNQSGQQRQNKDQGQSDKDSEQKKNDAGGRSGNNDQQDRSEQDQSDQQDEEPEERDHDSADDRSDKKDRRDKSDSKQNTGKNQKPAGQGGSRDQSKTQEPQKDSLNDADNSEQPEADPVQNNGTKQQQQPDGDEQKQQPQPASQGQKQQHKKDKTKKNVDQEKAPAQHIVSGSALQDLQKDQITMDKDDRLSERSAEVMEAMKRHEEDVQKQLLKMMVGQGDGEKDGKKNW
jgi:Ca-activated chloride channel family protein